MKEGELVKQIIYSGVRCTLIVALFGAHFGWHCAGLQVPLSFDLQLPQTAYKKALTTSIRLGELGELCNNPSLDSHDQLLVNDAYVGRSVKLQAAVRAMVDEHKQGAAIPDEDIVYLCDVVGQAQTAVHGLQEDQSLVQEIFKEIELLCSELLK